MSRRRPALAPLLVIAAFVAVITGTARHAFSRPTLPLDEPLWYMRSATVTPAHVCTAQTSFWATDVPGCNRWLYWLALRVTGRNVPPRGETCPWSMDSSGRAHWLGLAGPDRWQGRSYFPSTLAGWKETFGAYAPRPAIVTMRVVNISAFALMIVCMWYAARLVLQSALYAAVTVLPVALSPTLATDVAFVSWSGDIFLLTAQAAMLAVWLSYHLKGRAASPTAVLFVSVLAGAAVGSKLNGVLVLAAYVVYLVWRSRGRGRFLAPLASAAIAFAVFCALNPVVFLDPSGPIEVCMRFVGRRATLAGPTGPMGFTRRLAELVSWWPYLPVSIPLMWACRRKAWFPVVALWAAFLALGTVAGWYALAVPHQRYLAPLEEGLFFAIAVSALSLVVDSRRPAPDV